MLQLTSGTLLWSQLYVGPEWTTGFMEFTELQDGSILLAGTSSQVAVPGLRTLITKVDSVGNSNLVQNQRTWFPNYRLRL
ncbi:MAG: hypothetical protein IPN61_00970 [Bacteroidetes bacterium]|nr:hypothetical protein [Bacteroidota bacterium]